MYHLTVSPRQARRIPSHLSGALSELNHRWAVNHPRHCNFSTKCHAERTWELKEQAAPVFARNNRYFKACRAKPAFGGDAVTRATRQASCTLAAAAALHFTRTLAARAAGPLATPRPWAWAKPCSVLPAPSRGARAAMRGPAPRGGTLVTPPGATRCRGAAAASGTRPARGSTLRWGPRRGTRGAVPTALGRRNSRTLKRCRAESVLQLARTAPGAGPGQEARARRRRTSRAFRRTSRTTGTVSAARAVRTARSSAATAAPRRTTCAASGLPACRRRAKRGSARRADPCGPSGGGGAAGGGLPMLPPRALRALGVLAATATEAATAALMTAMTEAIAAAVVVVAAVAAAAAAAAAVAREGTATRARRWTRRTTGTRTAACAGGAATSSAVRAARGRSTWAACGASVQQPRTPVRAGKHSIPAPLSL